MGMVGRMVIVGVIIVGIDRTGIWPLTSGIAPANKVTLDTRITTNNLDLPIMMSLRQEIGAKGSEVLLPEGRANREYRLYWFPN